MIELNMLWNKYSSFHESVTYQLYLMYRHLCFAWYVCTRLWAHVYISGEALIPMLHYYIYCSFFLAKAQLYLSCKMQNREVTNASATKVLISQGQEVNVLYKAKKWSTLTNHSISSFILMAINHNIIEIHPQFTKKFSSKEVCAA